MAAALSCGCQAPRDNPFDPSSPAYRPPEPPERVEDLAFDSLDGLRCRLVWSASARSYDWRLYSGLPDWNGQDLARAERYTGELPGVKPAGTRQAAWIVLPEGQTRSWALFSVSVEGLMSPPSNIVVIQAPRRDRPATVAVTACAVRTAQWAFPDRLELEVVAAVADSDTVEIVWIKFRPGDVDTWPLAAGGDPVRWTRRFSEWQLPDGSLPALIGHPMTLYHLDRAGFVSHGISFSLLRVIDRVPEYLCPQPDDTVHTPTPRLEWMDFAGGFAYTYTVEVMHVPQESPGSPVLIYRREGISADSTGHQVETELTDQPLFLYWTVTVADEFGNQAVSLESRFWVVKDGG